MKFWNLLNFLKLVSWIVFEKKNCSQIVCIYEVYIIVIYNLSSGTKIYQSTLIIIFLFLYVFKLQVSIYNIVIEKVIRNHQNSLNNNQLFTGGCSSCRGRLHLAKSHHLAIYTFFVFLYFLFSQIQTLTRLPSLYWTRIRA